MTRYVLSPAAYADFIEILEYLEAESATAGKSIEEDFIQAFELLAGRPYLGHIREDFKGLPVRFWPVYPYLIVYAPATKPLQVVALLHGARDIPQVLHLRNVE